jgi:hypothetical protein
VRRSFFNNVVSKYVTQVNDVTYLKKVAALECAVNVLVTPYSGLTAIHIGDGLVKVVKENDDWMLPSPAVRLTESNTLCVLANGVEVCVTNKIDEALGALDNLLLEYIE